MKTATLSVSPAAKASKSLRSKSRSVSTVRSSSNDTTSFGCVVSPRSAQPTAQTTEKPQVPSFLQLLAAGGLTRRQAERLMACSLEATEEAAPITYQAPSVLAQQLSTFILCGTLAVIMATFAVLMMA